MRLRALPSFGLFVAFASLSVPAAAQQGGATPGASPSSGSSAAGAQGMESTPESLENPPKESPRSVKLFDNKRVTQSFALDIGPVYYRDATRGNRAGFERGTGELLVGVAATTTWKPFYLSGIQQTNLRIFDSESAAWSILTHQFAAGVHLGPLEPEVRVGIDRLSDSMKRHSRASGESRHTRAGGRKHVGSTLGERVQHASVKGR